MSHARAPPLEIAPVVTVLERTTSPGGLVQEKMGCCVTKRFVRRCVGLGTGSSVGVLLITIGYSKGNQDIMQLGLVVSIMFPLLMLWWSVFKDCCMPPSSTEWDGGQFLLVVTMAGLMSFGGGLLVVGMAKDDREIVTAGLLLCLVPTCFTAVFLIVHTLLAQRDREAAAAGVDVALIIVPRHTPYVPTAQPVAAHGLRPGSP